MPPKSHHTCFNCLDQHQMVCITWLQCWHQVHHMAGKLCCFSFWLFWHNEVSGAIDKPIGIPETCLDIVSCWQHSQWHLMPMLTPMASHDQKDHVAPCFSHLDLKSGKVPLTELFASCHTDTGTSGIAWPEQSCCTLFQSSWFNNCNGAIDKAVSITWCLCRCQ